MPDEDIDVPYVNMQGGVDLFGISNFKLLPPDESKIDALINQTKKVQKSPGVILGANYLPEVKSYPVCTAILGDFEFGGIAVERIHDFNVFVDKFGLVKTKDSLSCLSYLSRAPNLLVKRVIGTNSTNASMEGYDPIKITTITEFEETENFLHDDTFFRFIAQHPGTAGNFIRIAMLTLKDFNKNVEVIPGIFVKDVFGRIPSLNYGIIIFFKDQIKETFTIPFNQLSLLSYISKYVYCGSRITLNTSGVYDGLIDMYDGNKNYFLGGDDLYDGKFGYHDGNWCYADGNEKKNLFCVPSYYGDFLIQLTGGYTERPCKNDFIDAVEELENPDNYDIDLCIANNHPIIRKDIVNIVPCPDGIVQAVDFVKVYGLQFEGLDKFNNFMFLYGNKRVDKINVPLAGDYCGNRALTMLTDGLGVSTSKISKPLLMDNVIHNPRLADREILYENNINAVINDNGTFWCVGETIYKDKK